MDFIVTKNSGANAVYNYLNEYDSDKTLQVTIKPYCPDRSKEQNALMHVWFNYISQQYNLTHGELYSPAAWKEYLKSTLLGIESFDVPRGTMTRTKRTRDLSVKGMTEFMEQMVWYCATELNITLTGLEDS